MLPGCSAVAPEHLKQRGSTAAMTSADREKAGGSRHSGRMSSPNARDAGVGARFSQAPTQDALQPALHARHRVGGDHGIRGARRLCRGGRGQAQPSARRSLPGTQIRRRLTKKRHWTGSEVDLRASACSMNFGISNNRNLPFRPEIKAFLDYCAVDLSRARRADRPTRAIPPAISS